MRYKVEFQYRPKDNARPLDYVQEFDRSGDDHTFQPIPNISDQVHIEVFEADSSRGFLVVESRLFSYVGKPDDPYCAINIVLTDSDVDPGQLVKS
jgi:hypothetical protein